MSKLYLVCHEGHNFDSGDLFVKADSPQDAAAAWYRFGVENWGDLIDPSSPVRVYDAPTKYSTYDADGCVCWSDLPYLRLMVCDIISGK